jgi:hypothetical protein
MKDEIRGAKRRDQLWQEEELLNHNGILDKVKNHKDSSSCPLCGEQYKNGERVSICFKIHTSCLKKLKRLPKAT